MAQDDFGLDQFDDAFKPSKGFANSLEELPDGNYDFLITKTNLKRTQKAAKTIFEMILRVIGSEFDGVTGTKTVFLVSDDTIAIFGGELVKLGFDADKWNPKNNRKFSVEFPKIKDSLAGLAFKGTKKTNVDEATGKKYLNIYVNELIGRQEVQTASAAVDPSDPF